MDQPNFISILKQYRELISPVVKKYVAGSLVFPPYCQIDPSYQGLVDFQKDLISEYPNRLGKYFRPTMLISTALSMGVNIEETILPATAMQLSEDWILIHDDIEDESEQRRGFPTLQKMYSPALAINAGDALQTVMWKVIGDTNNKQIFEEFVHLLYRTTFGQTIDIKWNQDNKLDITDEDVFLILESKTCYYTVSGPMRLGAILAGASTTDLDTIYIFGRYLGRVFQIVDDILDLTSDFSGLKKQSYNDIWEGKRTIPLTHLIKSASPTELKTITSIFSKSRGQKTESEVQEIIDLMKKYRSIDSARELAVKFSIEARKILDEQMPFIRVEPYRNQLVAAIDFLVNRDH